MYMYVCMCVCVCIYIYIYMYTHNREIYLEVNLLVLKPGLKTRQGRPIWVFVTTIIVIIISTAVSGEAQLGVWSLFGGFRAPLDTQQRGVQWEGGASDGGIIL